jgi:aminoglycoside phosphotransferase (APT) family kinase protein
VLSELARAQAQLHSVPLSLPGRSLTFLSDASTAPSFGMFSIQAQFEDQVLSDGPNSRWLSHPFIKFLQPRLAELAACVAQAPALPQAVIHSDLFFENVIFQKPEQGDKVVGIIDFEGQ